MESLAKFLKIPTLQEQGGTLQEQGGTLQGGPSLQDPALQEQGGTLQEQGGTGPFEDKANKAKGGRIRAARLSSARRSEIALLGAAAAAVARSRKTIDNIPTEELAAAIRNRRVLIISDIKV